MPSSRCTCPACDARLKLAGEVPAGKKIRCPRCNGVFAFRADPDEEAIAESVPMGRAVSTPIDDEEPEPRPKRRRKRPVGAGKKSGSAALIIVPIVVVVLVLTAVGGWFVYDRVKHKTEVADATTTRPVNPIPPRPPGGAPIDPGSPVPPDGQHEPPPQPPGGSLEVGGVAPDILGEDIDGKPFKLSDYRGKVVLLDFWGHW